MSEKINNLYDIIMEELKNMECVEIIGGKISYNSPIVDILGVKYYAEIVIQHTKQLKVLGIPLGRKDIDLKKIENYLSKRIGFPYKRNDIMGLLIYDSYDGRERVSVLTSDFNILKNTLSNIPLCDD